MESFCHQRSTDTDRLLGLFSPPEPPNAGTVSGEELDEHDVFWTETDLSELNYRSPNRSSMASSNPNPGPIHKLSLAGDRRLPDRNFGILAALPEDDKKCSLQQRKKISSSSLSSAAESVSNAPFSCSFLSSARMIPAGPKSKVEYMLSVPVGKIFHQSAPMNVPMVPTMAGRKWGLVDSDGRGDEDGDRKMLPPHEMVARASAKESPLTTFSMLEGVGRTLKGRDLRRVRNAVWRQTGFLD